MRTIVQLSQEQVAALAEVCNRAGISRAEAIRRAVDRFLRHLGASRAEQQQDVFGSWRGRVGDALAYEDELRGPREQDARLKPARRRKLPRRG